MEKRASGNRDILFEVHSIICVRVRTTERYWRYVVEIKHPESFSDVEEAVEKAKNTLQNPEIVVKERIEPSVHLYYKRFARYFICVVAKHLNGKGYIITSYKTDRVKRGEVVWRR